VQSSPHAVWSRSAAARTLISVDLLPSGHQAIVLVLALPTRQTSLATLALAGSHGANVTLDSDILDGVRRTHHSGHRERVALSHPGWP